jgi:hypothetical protein
MIIEDVPKSYIGIISNCSNVGSIMREGDRSHVSAIGTASQHEVGRREEVTGMRQAEDTEIDGL